MVRSPESEVTIVNAAAAASKWPARGFCCSVIRNLPTHVRLTPSTAIVSGFTRSTNITLRRRTMRIEIRDDAENWLNWGNLVLTWIRNPGSSRPRNVGDLNRQLRDNHIEAKVDGPDTRPVEF